MGLGRRQDRDEARGTRPAAPFLPEISMSPHANPLRLLVVTLALALLLVLSPSQIGRAHV